MKHASEKEMLEFMRSTLELKELSATAAMGKVRGWDSLKHINLIVRLEEEYGVKIPADRIGELSSVATLIDFLRAEGVINA